MAYIYWDFAAEITVEAFKQQEKAADELYFRIKDAERRSETLEKEREVQLALKNFRETYTPPFRVGRKSGSAILDAKGKEVVILRGNCESEFMTQVLCDYLNTQFPSREEWVKTLLNIQDGFQRAILESY